MNWTIQFTDQSKDDIKEIYRYISYELLETEAADRLYKKLLSRIQGLTEMPLRFPQYRTKRSLRYFSVDNYLVFYRVIKKSSTVQVVRVLYGRRNLNTELKGK